MASRGTARSGAGTFALVAFLCLALGAQESSQDPTGTFASANGCLACHAGLEAMHPQGDVGCVDCHGGDAAARTKSEAHVASRRTPAGDERVAPLDEDLAWRRFRNPMDLRVAAAVCGDCHAGQVERVHTSLHATTAGHLSDGFYEMGLAAKKGSQYGVFPVRADSARKGEITELAQVPALREGSTRADLGAHYADLSRKECMQCHLWSVGRAVRGRVGFDGDYRGEGCAACHVPYAVDGLSESRDATISKSEPGHPLRHELTRAPPTQTCATCHYGDAAIGLDFRGLAQLPPGAPGGPQIPGSTDAPLNRAFYLDDPALCPPDVHHQRGMHCIDCHTANDVMGDGELHGAMENAVEISCSDCHGTFTERATLRTERGTPLAHLRRDGDKVVLTSKVDGKEHEVVQVVDVLDPRSARYKPAAARAMAPEHARLECYACHASWNPNFLGFHFDRNESLTQLDLLSGKRTTGRVTTQEKVFATWKSFYAGLNEHGRIAPYLTGFATMGSVRDARGELVIDQALPVTAAGLSGMSMVHHQTHTVRPAARACVECHRSSATWGLGSANFRLGRQLAFVADRRGVEIVALDRTQLSASTPLCKIVIPDVVALALDCDPLQGHARVLYAAERARGVHVVDVSDPTAPRRLAFLACVDPRDLTLAGDRLLCADGAGGVKVFDVADPARARATAVLPTFEANRIAVQWPYAYVADGPGGLAIVDIGAPDAPKLAGGLHVRLAPDEGDEIRDVQVLFQYGRPVADGERPVDRRTKARLVCAVVDESEGLSLVDVTEPSRPQLLHPKAALLGRKRAARGFRWTGLALRSHVDLAEVQGGSRTRERDYVYLAREFDQGADRRSSIMVFDVSDPESPRFAGETGAGQGSERLVVSAFYNPPFLQTIGWTPGDAGLFMTDLTISAAPRAAAMLPGIRSARAVAIEEFPFDRMLDEAGRPLKDVSHRDSRWLELPEIARVLAVDGERLGTIAAGAAPSEPPGASARLFLAQFDVDGSGALEGDECERARAVSLDQDGDGRVTLLELGASGRVLATDGGPTSPMTSMQDAAQAENEDGELAKLLDGVDPFAFDANKDDRLEREELARAYFAALDLDGDKALSRDEVSRRPGAARTLRFAGAAATARFAAFDTSGDGKVAAREFKVEQAELDQLDRDRDGAIRLVDEESDGNRKQTAARTAEWPKRRREITALPPEITVERILAQFDADRDGVLVVRELKTRPDLMREMDKDMDNKLTSIELATRVARVLALGVDASADGFVRRWDLDGDGKVEDGELPKSALPAARRAHKSR